MVWLATHHYHLLYRGGEDPDGEVKDQRVAHDPCGPIPVVTARTV